MRTRPFRWDTLPSQSSPLLELDGNPRGISTAAAYSRHSPDIIAVQDDTAVLVCAQQQPVPGIHWTAYHLQNIISIIWQLSAAYSDRNWHTVLHLT